MLSDREGTGEEGKGQVLLSRRGGPRTRKEPGNLRLDERQAQGPIGLEKTRFFKAEVGEKVPFWGRVGGIRIVSEGTNAGPRWWREGRSELAGKDDSLSPSWGQGWWLGGPRPPEVMKIVQWVAFLLLGSVLLNKTVQLKDRGQDR